MAPMSESEYVSEGGTYCPNCRSGNIEGGGERNYDADWCSIGVKCLDCGTTWDDIFTLSGYYNLVVPA